jgi:hypothetical protein
MNVQFMSNKMGKKFYIKICGTTGRQSKALGEDLDKSHNAFSKGIKALSSIGQPFYISAGTALGVVRDKAFIPHDQDIDVEILTTYEDPINADEIVKSFNDHGFILVRTMYDGEFPQQLAFINDDDIIFDIWLVYQDAEEGSGVTYTDLGKLITPNRFLENMKESLWEIDGRFYNITLPNDPEDYCEVRYGSTWRTPKTYKGPWEEDAGNLE